MDNVQKLRELYPNLKSLKGALKKAGTQKALASSLNMSSFSLYRHKKRLECAYSPVRIAVGCKDVKLEDVSERIRELHTSSEVRVYKIVDPSIYRHGEYDGLEFVGVQRGPKMVDIQKAYQWCGREEEEC